MSNQNITAALFKNERKEHDGQPDFTGPGTVTPETLKALYEAAISDQATFDNEGRIKIRVAGWRKTSSSGKSYISLSVSLDRPRPATSAPAPTSATSPADDFLTY